MEPVFAPVCSEDSSFLKQNVIATICCQKDDLSSALSYIDHLKKLTFFFFLFSHLCSGSVEIY
jgi:hypothetical protein